MRLLGVTAGLGVALGCSSSSVFICEGDSSCNTGRCETNGYCSFPTPNCESGWVYGEFSAPGLAGTCVGDPVDTTTAPPPGTTTDEPTTNASRSSSSSTSYADTSYADTSYADTSYADTSYGYESSDGGYTYTPYFCRDYASLISTCYSDEDYDPALMYCASAYDMFYEQYYECGYAFGDFMACLSSLDCEQLESSFLYCEDQQNAFEQTCFG